MADVIQAAPSGRSKCRACGKVVVKGELRFGESIANPYAEGDTLLWFHPACAALMRPEKLLPLLEAKAEPLPDRDALLETARFAAAHRRVPRLAGAERASSGRATCRHCRELIEKGAMRLRLRYFNEGRVEPGGFIHLTCAVPYFETADLLRLIEKTSEGLTETDVDEIRDVLASSAAAGPGVAKAVPRDEPVSETGTGSSRG